MKIKQILGYFSQDGKLRRKMDIFLVSMSVELLYNQFAQFLEFVYSRWQVLNIFDCGHHKRLVTWPKWRAIWQCKRAWETGRVNCIIWKLQDFVVKPYTKHIPPAVVWSLKTIPPNAPCPLLPLSLLSYFNQLSIWQSSQLFSKPTILHPAKKLPIQLPFLKPHFNSSVSLCVFCIMISFSTNDPYHLSGIALALCWPGVCNPPPISETEYFVILLV